MKALGFAIGLAAVLALRPAVAASASVPAPPPRASLEECDEWSQQTRRMLAAQTRDRSDRICGRGRSCLGFGEALSENSRLFAEELRQLRDYWRQCRYEARARQGAREMLTRLVPSSERRSIEYGAYARLSPHLAEVSVIGGAFRRAGDFLALPSIIGNLRQSSTRDVGSIYEAANFANDFLPGFSSWRGLTLGLLQTIHEDSFRQLDVALGDIQRLSSYAEMEQAQQTVLRTRTLLVAQHSEVVSQRVLLNRQFSPEVLTAGQVAAQAATARAQEQARAQAAAQARAQEQTRQQAAAAAAQQQAFEAQQRRWDAERREQEAADAARRNAETQAIIGAIGGAVGGYLGSRGGGGGAWERAPQPTVRSGCENYREFTPRVVQRTREEICATMRDAIRWYEANIEINRRCAPDPALYEAEYREMRVLSREMCSRN